MELEGDFFGSQAKFFVDFYQCAHFGATPAQERETVVQKRNNSQGNHNH